MVHETLTIFTLRNGRELHLDTPDWYFQAEGDFSIRTPNSTHVVYNKSAQSNRPFTEDFIQRQYLSQDASDKGSQLESNQLSIKPFGEEEQVFELLVTEEGVENYCKTYPPLTIVDSK